MCPDETVLEPGSKRPDYGRLTRRQAEHVAGVSRATLYRYRDENKLSVFKDEGGQTFYDAAELARVFPDTFDVKRLETPVSKEGVGQPETSPAEPRDASLLASLTIEKRYLTEDRDRLKEEAERLRNELADERRSRDQERAEFMSLIRQNQETVKQLTHQPEKAVESAPAAPRHHGLLGLFRKI